MFDCHVHSSFSGDSEMPAELACETAKKAGLSGLAFTDHLDYDYPNFDEKFLIDFDIYNEFMDKLKFKHNGGFKVLKGIEAGIQPHVIEDTQALVRKYDFDFVIGSIHIIDRIDPYYGEYYEGRTKVQAYSRYLEEILYMLNNFSDFDVMGHIDYIIRYCKYSDRSMRYNEHCDVMDAIFKRLVTMGKGMELNTGAFREKEGHTIPEFDENIIRRYRELGGEIICLGSDAHFPEYIGYKFDYFKEIIKKAGFNYLAHFENRKPIFEKI